MRAPNKLPAHTPLQKRGGGGEGGVAGFTTPTTHQRNDGEAARPLRDTRANTEPRDFGNLLESH